MTRIRVPRVVSSSAVCVQISVMYLSHAHRRKRNPWILADAGAPETLPGRGVLAGAAAVDPLVHISRYQGREHEDCNTAKCKEVEVERRHEEQICNEGLCCVVLLSCPILSLSRAPSDGATFVLPLSSVWPCCHVAVPVPVARLSRTERLSRPKNVVCKLNRRRTESRAERKSRSNGNEELSRSN